jgi:hypothetical protein
MATEQAAAELKQQGAIEAARNPESSVSAEDAQKKMLEESKAAGVAAFTFDPDATPEQKRAQAREVSSRGWCPLPAIVPLTLNPQGCPRRFPFQAAKRRCARDR